MKKPVCPLEAAGSQPIYVAYFPIEDRRTGKEMMLQTRVGSPLYETLIRLRVHTGKLVLEQPLPEENCNCDLQVLMSQGCQCGGV